MLNSKLHIVRQRDDGYRLQVHSYFYYTDNPLASDISIMYGSVEITDSALPHTVSSRNTTFKTAVKFIVTYYKTFGVVFTAVIYILVKTKKKLVIQHIV